tara:strand:- start:702 stop:995 length:294 start_codon:yes stop_codon:yes gene_type:complete
MQESLTIMIGAPATGKTSWANQNGKIELYGLCNRGANKITQQVEDALSKGHQWEQLAISVMPNELHNCLIENSESDLAFLERASQLWPGKPVRVIRF